MLVDASFWGKCFMALFILDMKNYSVAIVMNSFDVCPHPHKELLRNLNVKFEQYKKIFI